MNATRADVIDSIRVLFPANDGDRILALLDEYGTPHGKESIPRVQMAILVLCDGDEQRLRSELAVAKNDYRDVVTGAEYTKGGLQMAETLRTRRMRPDR